MTPVMSLVDVDAELVAGVPDQDLELARRTLRRPRYDIPAGRWAPELMGAHEGGFALLVVDGAILREVRGAGRCSAQLLGPGDVLQEAPAADGALGWQVAWTAMENSSVVVLDARFTLAARRWPVLGLNLQRRLLDQADRLATSLAIAHLPRVEERVLAFMWLLADRWGAVTPFGVTVGLKLTHQTLGHLVGAQRPTVSLALTELAESEELTRSPQGGWILQHKSRERLAPAAAVSQ